MRSTKSRPKRSATTRASWSWRRIPRSTSTTPVGRPCSRAAATRLLDGLAVGEAEVDDDLADHPRASAPGGAAGTGPSALVRPCAVRLSRGRPRPRPRRARHPRTCQRLAWRIAHHRLLSALRRARLTRIVGRFRSPGGGPVRSGDDGAAPVLERALDLSVERVEPIQSERLGRGKALPGGLLGPVVEDHAVLEREPALAVEDRRARARRSRAGPSSTCPSSVPSRLRSISAP